MKTTIPLPAYVRPEKIELFDDVYDAMNYSPTKALTLANKALARINKGEVNVSSSVVDGLRQLQTDLSVAVAAALSENAGDITME